MMPPGARDHEMMRRACAEARRWLGASSPNPAVGAIACDSAGNILAIAAHQKAGQAHAEILALAQCRTNSTLDQIDTLYVTLEPCNHHGRTGPCTDAIIAAGIRRVVVGARDPNPQVQGGGIERLRAAGIDLITGVEAQPCILSMHAFFHKAQTGNPWITVKRAFDAQGSMLPPAGQKTFTSPDSLKLAHRLRKKCDAIITGSGTIICDKPLFNVRHVQDHAGKRRQLAILDRRSRVPQDYIQQAWESGLDATIYRDLDKGLLELTRQGAQDILVEAGPTLSQSMLDSGQWTMKVDIHQGEPDRIDIAFNPAAAIAFDRAAFRLDDFLPA